MDYLERLDRVIFGGNPQLRHQVARETVVEFAKQNLAWLSSELEKAKIQYRMEKEAVAANGARPLDFRIPQLWHQADKIDGSYE